MNPVLTPTRKTGPVAATGGGEVVNPTLTPTRKTGTEAATGGGEAANRTLTPTRKTGTEAAAATGGGGFENRTLTPTRKTGTEAAIGGGGVENPALTPTHNTGTEAAIGGDGVVKPAQTQTRKAGTETKTEGTSFPTTIWQQYKMMPPAEFHTVPTPTHEAPPPKTAEGQANAGLETPKPQKPMPHPGPVPMSERQANAGSVKMVPSTEVGRATPGHLSLNSVSHVNAVVRPKDQYPAGYNAFWCSQYAALTGCGSTSAGSGTTTSSGSGTISTPTAPLAGSASTSTPTAPWQVYNLPYYRYYNMVPKIGPQAQIGLWAAQTYYDIVNSIYDIFYNVLGAFDADLQGTEALGLDPDLNFAAGETPSPSGNINAADAISPETQQRLAEDAKQGLGILTDRVSDKLLGGWKGNEVPEEVPGPGLPPEPPEKAPTSEGSGEMPVQAPNTGADTQTPNQDQN